MATIYHYTDVVNDEIKRCLRGLFPPGISIKRASTQEDFGGVDVQYIVHHDVDLQLRARFDRPAYAADSDITFRTTEPAMIAANTYAPLAVFVWFNGHQIVAGKLVDIYRMAARIEPSLETRPVHRNSDHSGFHIVEIAELHRAGALLRLFDGRVWATAILGGEARLNRILS